MKIKISFKSEKKKELEYNIKQILKYSFSELGKVHPYEHLTETERKLITKKQYKDIVKYMQSDG